MSNVKISNWKRSISYHANSIEKVNTVEDIQRIVTDAKYPSPVRVMGSHHSTTRCIVAEGGTVIDIRDMNRIIDIDKEKLTITMEAGMLQIDAAKELEKNGLQFYVNIELGNLTMGSGACGGTKDASYYSKAEGWEGGQVCCYCIGFKTVQADGSVLEVTEENPELIAAMRTSYGMLGVIYEVTYRVKPISAMAMEHKLYTVDEFADQVEDLVKEERSIMYYLFPFLDRVVVEFRQDVDGEVESGSWQWRLRNFIWKTGWPALAKILYYLIPVVLIRHRVLNFFNRLTYLILAKFKDSNSSPADQIIRYSETAGFASYTFSIWSFPREEIRQTIRDYFAFQKQYFKDNKYRCDMLNVGYHIVQDRRALFSYTRHGPALTLDPVSTGLPGWEEFLVAYNEFCIQHNGTPLFNQTTSVTPAQAQHAFGEEIKEFQTFRKKMDPDDRFYGDYFKFIFDS